MRSIFASAFLFAAAVASAQSVAALETEWDDLQSRCEAAVTQGERLDVAGLRNVLPNVTAEITENDVYGYDLNLELLGPGGRTLPTGVWLSQGARLELWLIEYPTKSGFRAVCEVRAGRLASAVTRDEAAQLRAAFVHKNAGSDRSEIARDNPRVTAFRYNTENARGCPVVTSFSTDDTQAFLRSSVSEAAGAPSCGGPSLASHLLTPHGVVPSNVQGG